ncbi:MAG: SWIM zinc finger family protein [Verrucomicrobiales bacterium]
MITKDQVTALAPDAASFKAGKALATPRMWSGLGRNGSALWGLAQGSGKNPYQTQVMVGDFAYKCSCPSRKFPCKHALGLMFIAAENLAQFPDSEFPEWVAEWHESRQDRKAKADAKSKTASDKPKDEAAAAKRKTSRSNRVDEGVSFFDALLLDLIRNGLGQESVTDRQAWDGVAKRLVDCQCTGLAGFARRLGEVPHSGVDWEHRLLLEFGSLHLLLSSYRSRESLSPELRAEVEQLVGWPVEKASVIAAEGVADDWFVASRTFTENDRLITSATWLYGQTTRRWGLVLNFASLPSRPTDPWPIGGVVKTTLAYYPGAAPDRVVPKVENATASLACELPSIDETFVSMLGRSAAGLAANPWRTRCPFLLQGQPATHRGGTFIVDLNGDALPWQPRGNDEKILCSICAGHPVLLAGEWDGRMLTIHSAADGTSWFSLRSHVA